MSAGRSAEEMRNSYWYLREGFSGKYLALYVIMENGVFVIIVNYTLYIYRPRYNYQDIKAKLDWTYYEDAGRKPSKETYLTE